MQKNLSADIQELASRANLKWATMSINVNTAVSGYSPFTYKGSNGSNNKTIIAAFPSSPDSSANWIFSVSTRINGTANMIDVYANRSAAITVYYLYIDR